MTDPLSYQITTGPRDLALALIHPLGADRRFWDDFIACWERPEPLLSHDLRSAGRAPRAARPLSPADHAADLEAIRRHAGVKRLVPVGCAIGSMVAASYAALYPDTTAALVMANPARQTTATARSMLQERAERVRAEGMAALMPGAVDRAFLDQPQDERYRSYRAWFEEQDAEAYALSILGVLDADLSAVLPDITCPTLLVAGGHDVLLPLAQAEAVHGSIAGSELQVDAEAAHFVPFQAPRRFRDRVAAFLDARVTAGRGR